MSENKSARIPLPTNDIEMGLIKDAFTDNDELLVSVRALLLGFPIEKSEADVIKSTFSNDQLLTAFRKKLYFKLSPESVIGEGGDYWFGTDSEISGRDPETIHQVMGAKHRVLAMFEQAIELLKNPFSKEKIDLTFKSTKEDPYQIEFLARNKYTHAVNIAISMVMALKGLKNETVAQTKERLNKDSSK